MPSDFNDIVLLITELLQLLLALALLFFAWKASKRARTPALLAGLIFLLRAVFDIVENFMHPGPPNPWRFTLLFVDDVLIILGLACVVWLVSRLKE